MLSIAGLSFLGTLQVVRYVSALKTCLTIHKTLPYLPERSHANFEILKVIPI
jgi:hypothetical protein